LFKPGQGADGGLHPRQPLTPLDRRAQWCRGGFAECPASLGFAGVPVHRTGSDRWRGSIGLPLANRGSRTDTLPYEAHGENEARHEGGFVQRQCI